MTSTWRSDMEKLQRHWTFFLS